MPDKENFRCGIGMVICNDKHQVFWAERADKNTWQFPQGGILTGESPERALYRELEEETGLRQGDIKILGKTRHWLKYEWPESTRMAHVDPECLGQTQQWFLLKLISDDTAINIKTTPDPEFKQWQWVDYWYPLNHVVYFKKQLYQTLLAELATYLHD